MRTRGAAILLVLLTSAHRSLQDSTFNPAAFSNWDELRGCAQNCLNPSNGDGLSPLGCSLNDCFCRADIVPQAVSIVSSCASSGCSDTNDVSSATSFYEAYCSSATNTAVFSLINNSPPSAVPGSTVTGTITATITTTLANGQPTVIGTIIYQYGSDDNIGGQQSNNNKSGAVRQAANFLQSTAIWGFVLGTLVTAVMFVAA